MTNEEAAAQNHAAMGQGQSNQFGLGFQLKDPTPTPKPDASFEIIGNPAELFGALAKARGDFRTVAKNRHVKVDLKGGGGYEFDYATLDEVQDATCPALSANGLSIIQPLCDLPGGGKEIRTLLCHASGAYIQCRTRLPAYERVQELGSAITYMRRYHWQCLTGVTAEEDDDGNQADGNRAQTQARDRSRPAPPPKTQGQSGNGSAAQPSKPTGKAPSKPQDAPVKAETPASDPKPPAPAAPPPSDAPAPTELLATADKVADMKALFVSLQFKGTPAKECIHLLTGKDAGTVTNPDVEVVCSVLKAGLAAKWDVERLMSLIREQAALGVPEGEVVIAAIAEETAALGGG
jgi:hypothetical protein